MSFLKFWGKKSKAKDDDLRKEEPDAEAEKRKLRHTLSISRSGRFKQKNRERGGILDRPELYGGEGVEGDYAKEYKDYQEHSMCSETSSSASTTSTSSSASSSASRPPPPPSSSSSSTAYPLPHQGNRRAGHSMAT